MVKQYLAPNKTGGINGINVKAISIKSLSEINQKYPCAKCYFREQPFNCCFENKYRPACCSGDIENESKEPIYYVKV